MMQTSGADAWFPFNRFTNPKPHRIFCFPYGGGNPVFFREWQQWMSKEVELFPVQLPGRGMRMHEESYQAVEPLLEELSQAMLPIIQSSKSVAFFGHSMGALVVYRLSLYLQDQYGILPDHLYVSGFRAPHLPSRKAPIHHLPDEQFADKVVELGGMPEELLANPEYLQLFLPALRADFTICETYQLPAQKILRAPITVFGGTEDPETSVKQLKAWQELTPYPITLHLLEGNHFFIHSHQKEITEVLAGIYR